MADYLKAWTMAHLAKPLMPDPIGHGWAMEDDVIVPVFFEGMTALDKLQDFFFGCLGATKCQSEELCPCFKDGLSCSEVCRCEGDEQCSNPNRLELPQDDDEGD